MNIDDKIGKNPFRKNANITRNLNLYIEFVVLSLNTSFLSIQFGLKKKLQQLYAKHCGIC